MASMEGMRLGAYELIERIGGGGMAEVYRARQSTAFGREVAIKVIRAGFSEDASFRERFLREAQAISRLSHPNILPLIEFGEEHATLYLVMPLAREGTLRDLLRQRNGPLPLEEAVPLFTQLCNAVQYAHEQGIIHRDLKPQNVLLQQRTHVLLADFGIARDTAETQHMTTTGAGIGTVEYMAPEQAVGQATLQSDIYSLGIVLYQLLTGTVPYSGSTPFQVLMKHTNDPLPDPRLLIPSLPAELVQVLHTALAKDPQQRFPSAQALARAAQQVRPDALFDLPTRTSATQPPRSSIPLVPPSLTNRTTWHGQDFRERTSAPVPPEFPSGPTPSRPGDFTGGWSARREPPPPPGWASVAPAEEEDDPPAWSIQGGRTARTTPGWQPRERIGSPYAGGGPVPQQSALLSRRGVLIVALSAALLLLLLVSGLGAAGALGLFTTQSGGQHVLIPSTTLVSQPTGATGVPGTPPGTAAPTATGTAAPTTGTSATTRIPSPSPKSSPSPSVTPTPTPTPLPPSPYPDIHGNYNGSYSGGSSMTLQINQSGQTLSGTINASGTPGTISGTIDTTGSFTFDAYFPSTGVTTTFSGSIVSPGKLSGTYSNFAANGTWSATKV